MGGTRIEGLAVDPYHGQETQGGNAATATAGWRRERLIRPEGGGTLPPPARGRRHPAGPRPKAEAWV